MDDIRGVKGLIVRICGYMQSSSLIFAKKKEQRYRKQLDQDLANQITVLTWIVSILLLISVIE